jgi:hypothetical protein
MLVITALILSSAVEAQQISPAGRSIIVSGFAVDSVRGRFLTDARVSVVGSDINAITDSLGAFHLAIPVGTHSIEIRHPFLDSLGITLTTSPRSFDGPDTTIVISVPSPETIVNAKCPASDRAKGPAVLTGIVVDALTDAPAQDATVSVGWTDYEVVKRSIIRTPQRRVAKVSENGTFKLCGLPDGLVEGVIASRGSQSTAGVDFDLSSLIEVGAFRIPPPKNLKGSAKTVSISGRVLDLHGQPAGGARVAIDEDSATATTNESGYFTLTDVRIGTRAISIRKLGYEALEIPIEVPTGGATSVALGLGRSVEMLKAMLVTSSLDQGLKKVGFLARRRVVAGSFLGPAEIDRIFPSRLAQVLERIPRFQRGGACVRYYVDNRLMPEGENPENFVQGVEIGAIEVYTEAFVPGEFRAFTRLGKPCRAVVIWTKWKIGLR